LNISFKNLGGREQKKSEKNEFKKTSSIILKAKKSY